MIACRQINRTNERVKVGRRRFEYFLIYDDVLHALKKSRLPRLYKMALGEAQQLAHARAVSPTRRQTHTMHRRRVNDART